MFSRKKFTINNRDKYLLDPEEILLDKKAEEMGEEETIKLEWPLSSALLKYIWLIGFILLAIVFSRVFYLSVVKGSYYADLSSFNKTRYYIINAPRGIIFDRNNQPLVNNVPSFSLTLVPLDLPRDEMERENLTQQVTKIFNLNSVDLDELLKEKGRLSSLDPILLKSNVSVAELRQFEASIEPNKGFTIITDTARQYPYGESLAHVIGYLGKISAQEKAKYNSYPLTVLVGKEGLEEYYESELQGEWGKRLVEVDASGKVVQDLGTLSPKKGDDLITTLDVDLQIKLYQSLTQRIEELGVTAGAALALNPKTGEILALVSVPSFDPNIMTQGFPVSTINSYLKDVRKPLFNRVISGLYFPGSLIKPLMALAALEEKIITPERKIFDEGKIVITSPYNPQVKYTFTDMKPHGWVDVKKALAVSCNVYFWTVGGGYGDIQGLGLSRIQKYWHLFGLGEKDGLDLNDENTGVLPDEEWLKRIRPQDPLWKLGDTYNISIREGGLSLTPLEMADYIATIANNGTSFKPYLAKEIKNQQGEIIKTATSSVLVRLDVSPQNLKVVQEGMREVVTSGTATELNNLPFKVAGKSGSPEFVLNGKKHYHAIFGAYAPYEDPQIVLLVLIEDIPQGSVATLSVVSDVLNWYYENRFATSTNQSLNF